MDNPETSATVGIQDTGWRQNKNYNKKTKKMSNMDPMKKKRGVNQVLANLINQLKYKTLGYGQITA
jgi:hypothetical protein